MITLLDRFFQIFHNSKIRKIIILKAMEINGKADSTNF